MRAIIVSTMLLLSACNSITFVQYEQEGEQARERRWHHSTINGLVEVSKPLDLKALCEDKAWNSVKTEYTFWNGLVAVLIPTVGVSLYTPWTNEVECFQPPVKNTAG